MRGIIVDCKTGKQRVVKDGLPRNPPLNIDWEANSVNLAEVKAQLKEIDELKAKLMKENE